MQSFNVDWSKTIENIKFLLAGRTYTGNLSDAFSLSVRAVQRKLSSKNKSGLSIEELAIVARYLRCDIWDLVVFETDPFFAPNTEEIKKYPWVEHRSPEDVTRSLLVSDGDYIDFPIRDIYEFLLYLPLIDEQWLRDVVYRCYGNYGPMQRDYIMNQLGFLYNSIPESPEKAYADYCRDNELRAKGDKTVLFDSMDGESEYWSNLFRYRSNGNSGLSEEKFKSR